MTRLADKFERQACDCGLKVQQAVGVMESVRK